MVIEVTSLEEGKVIPHDNLVRKEAALANPSTINSNGMYGFLTICCLHKKSRAQMKGVRIEFRHPQP